ncbi:hypothetical protein [uncultured Desulfobacter sp.]|uniref:hypothetical protein n=1 Tax=uncultured Desulfobacter sp. TaxID=240139 RepID=UPI0029F5C746|nr:hypothetical protein [uncultured Desulfobacter sp.]
MKRRRNTSKSDREAIIESLAKNQRDTADAQRLVQLIDKIGKGLVPELTGKELRQAICQLFFEDHEGLMLKGGLKEIPPGAGVYKNTWQFKKIRNMALNKFQQELKSRIKFLEKYKINRFPLKWMQNDSLIAANMSKKGNRLFYPIYEHLVEHRMPFAESRGFNNANISVDSPQVTNPIIVHASQKQMAVRFNSDSTTLNRIFQEMVLYGILLPYKGRNGKTQSYYVIGRWSHVRNKNPRPIYFLKDSPKMRRALRNFRVSKRNDDNG